MPPKKGDKNQNIQVMVRCRPLSTDEKRKGGYNVTEVNCERKDVTIKERLGVTSASKTFCFDKVFGPEAKQIDVYKSVCAPIIDEVLLGYNCTVFAYGQTGTGKTFTMEGERSPDPNISWESDPLSGLIPRAMNQLFTRLERNPDCEYSVRVSFLEIYNEELIDLLGAESVENPRLRIYEDNYKKRRDTPSGGSCVIQGLEDVVVRNKDEVYGILQLGAARRQTAATLMNAHSSRSHSLFTVTIHIKENSVEGDELLKTGKLNLVDLAGSECIGRSGAVDKRAREAGQINQSLLTLGRVISALVEHAPHVPYRESKLTRLLQDSLGGRTKTSIIATISPASSNLEETLSTLDYAHRAKNIQNKPEINQKLNKKTLLKEFNEEIERLRRDLQAARDKNGVFLAHENYEAMQTQIAQQTDKIKELSEQLEMKLTEMEKLSSLFTETKEELAETKEDLTVTTKNLEDTTQNLKVTKGHLRKTTQDRDEQRHLVGKHVKTETKLHQQATQLLYTSEEASSDVGGLHSKLDRKRKVEDHNEATQDSFSKRFRDNIDEMQESLKAHLGSDLDHVDTSHRHLGEMLDRRSQEVSGMSGELDSVLKQVTDRVEAVVGSYTTHTGLAQEWVQSLKEHVIKTRDTELCRQFDFHDQTFETSMTTVESQLNNLTTDLGSLSKFVQDTMNAHKSAVSKLVHDQLAHLERQSELVDKFYKEEMKQREKDSEQVTTMFQSQHSLNKTLADELLQNVNKLVNDMVSKQQHNLTGNEEELQQGHNNGKTRLNTYHGDSMQGIQVLSDDSKSGLDTIHRVCDEKITESKGLIDQLKGGVESTMHTTLGLQQRVTEFSEETRTMCTEGATELTSRADAHSQQLDSAKLAYISAAEELRTTHTTTLQSLDSTQVSQNAELQQSIVAQQSVHDKHREEVGQWSDKMAADMEARDHQVATFLTEELSKDVPTGTTPQRRDFTYPRTLTKTDKHSLILGEFRKEYILEEAINTPIPDDSFTSQASQAPPSLNLDDAEDLENDDDGMNTSTDSALSTASALSSVTDANVKNLPLDKQQSESKENLHSSLDKNKSESKENIRMPPPPGVPKSRQGSAIRSNSASRTPKSKTPVVKPPTPGKKTAAMKNITPSNLPRARGKLPLRSSNP